MKENKTEYKESFVIKYSNKLDPNNHLLDIFVVHEEQDKIIKIYNSILKKNKFFENQELYINFNPGSSKMEMKFRALITNYAFDLDVDQTNRQIIISSLWTEFTSFEEGMKKIKSAKLKANSYTIEREVENNFISITLKLDDKIIWKGKEEIYNLIASEKTESKISKSKKIMERALLTQNEREISLKETTHDDENLLKYYGEKTAHTSEISSDIKKINKEIEDYRKVTLETKEISNYKMNITAGNIWIPETDEQKWANVIPLGSLVRKPIKVLFPGPIPPILPGQKNYIEADVLVTYEKNKIKKIEIKEIKKIEANKRAFSQAEHFKSVVDGW